MAAHMGANLGCPKGPNSNMIKCYLSLSLSHMYHPHNPKGGGPSGEDIGLRGMLPTRSKIQHWVHSILWSHQTEGF
jgi:hypothetical protein